MARMIPALKKFFTSGQMQLNFIGVVILIILAICAKAIIEDYTIFSLIPLGCIGYAAFSVIFELTFNRANVPTLATSRIVRSRVINILKKETDTYDDTKYPYTILDMGSGRGELARSLALAIPQAKIIGIEKAQIPYTQSSLIQRWLGPDNLAYQCLDFTSFDCSSIQAVYFYLTPTLAQKMGEKLDKELKAGSMVISYTFPLLTPWSPDETLEFWSPFKETIYIYRKP